MKVLYYHIQCRRRSRRRWVRLSYDYRMWTEGEHVVRERSDRAPTHLRKEMIKGFDRSPGFTVSLIPRLTLRAYAFALASLTYYSPSLVRWARVNRTGDRREPRGSGTAREWYGPFLAVSILGSLVRSEVGAKGPRNGCYRWTLPRETDAYGGKKKVMKIEIPSFTAATCVGREKWKRLNFYLHFIC